MSIVILYDVDDTATAAAHALDLAANGVTYGDPRIVVERFTAGGDLVVAYVTAGEDCRECFEESEIAAALDQARARYPVWPVLSRARPYTA